MNTCDSPAKLTTSVPKADTWHVYCIKRHEMLDGFLHHTIGTLNNAIRIRAITVSVMLGHLKPR